MGDLTGLVVRSIILSFVMGMSCQMFFGTVVPMRKMRYAWMEHTAVMAYTAGFMVIAVTEIPPYVLQPVRVIVAIFIVSQIYFRVHFLRNLTLSVVFCGIYWIVSVFFLSVASVMPVGIYREWTDMFEPVIDLCYLFLVLVFRYWFRKRFHALPDVKWGKFGLLAMAGIVVSVAVAVMSPEGSAEDYYARLLTVTGFAVVYVFGLYYMVNTLEKESQIQKLRLLHERTRNQMNLYQGMKERYEQQRRYWHDYKNQLNCIQGMIGNGQTKEALQYIEKLTGSLYQGDMCVNTNHGVVNVMLNQKYREAYNQGIAMTMIANDLSGLTVSEEDIVTLLGNLLDNAVEACRELERNRVIQFKMILEEGQLILSVRNPVEKPVLIKNNRIVTSKQDKSRHGIGLFNVDSVVRKNGGTSVLKCEDGWFSFTAVIPAETGNKTV